MSIYTDRETLRKDQYRDASNLDARFVLHDRFSVNRRGWHEWVFAHLDLPAESAILELGCGPAYLWSKNLDRVPPGWRVTLSDLSPGMIREARQNLGDHRSLCFAVIDAQSIPFASGSLDGVIANHMLYHVPDLERALSEIRRVLRPGGRLYASTVGRRHMRDLWKLVGRSGVGAGDAGGPKLLSFDLDTGQQVLAGWFSEVGLRRYEDALRVTEAEPLVAYVSSSLAAKPHLAGDGRAAFRRFVEQELEQHGAIRIAKDTGMFEAIR